MSPSRHRMQVTLARLVAGTEAGDTVRESPDYVQ
jgi:hypothetical protein